jgi:hypothetical protein
MMKTRTLFRRGLMYFEHRAPCGHRMCMLYPRKYVVGTLMGLCKFVVGTVGHVAHTVPTTVPTRCPHGAHLIFMRILQLLDYRNISLFSFKLIIYDFLADIR